MADKQKFMYPKIGFTIEYSKEKGVRENITEK